MVSVQRNSDVDVVYKQNNTRHSKKAINFGFTVARPPGTDPDIADASFTTSGSGTGVCDVDTVVDDVNDNRPRFQFPIAGDDTIIVRAKDAGIGHVIGQVQPMTRMLTSMPSSCTDCRRNPLPHCCLRRRR